MKNMTSTKKVLVMESIKAVGSADNVCAVADHLCERLCNKYDDNVIERVLKRLDMYTIRDVKETIEQFIAYNEQYLYEKGYLSELQGRELAFKIAERKKNNDT